MVETAELMAEELYFASLGSHFFFSFGAASKEFALEGYSSSARPVWDVCRTRVSDADTWVA